MAYNTDQVVVAVSDGTLLVFPAWLPHSVSANTSNRLRVSVSFNVMFTEYDTTMSPPLWGAVS
jgi:ectoine hydroxylase-related dioxygenase (phytanoyl-CoA dioxygenase family)